MRPTASCQEARQRPLPPATCRRARRASGCVRCPRRAGPTSRPTSSSRTRTRRRARRFTPPRRKSRPDYAQMHRCLVALPPPQAKGAPRFARWRACHGCHRAAPACGHAASAHGWVSCAAASSLFPPHAGGALRVRRDGARAAAGGAAGVIRLGWLRAPALVAARSPRLQAVVAARGAARPAGRPGSGATRRGRNVSVAVPAWPRKGAPSRPGSTIQTAARIPHRATPLPDPSSPLLGACMQVAEASIPAASIPEALALPLFALAILVVLLGFLLWARHSLARRHPNTASPGEMDGCDDGGSCSSGGGTSGYPSRGTPYWGLVMSSPASSPDSSPAASPSRASCAPART